MCEANAYLVKDGKEHLILESVDLVEPRGEDTWHLVDIYGDRKDVKGRISGMNLVNHKILFEEIST